jgi:hypothetical protein
LIVELFTRFLVKTAAAVQGFSQYISAKSRFVVFDGLIEAHTP